MNFLEKAKILYRRPVTGQGRYAVVTDQSVFLFETYGEACRNIVSPKHCRVVDLGKLPTMDEALAGMRDRYEGRD
jgi:hypothetical protein